MGLEINKIHQGDCMELMKKIPDGSVDMILCDLPYGMIDIDWDVKLDFTKLWQEYRRIIKERAAVILTASQPFTSELVMSNPKMFRYELIWHKTKASGFVNANKMPMKGHENILVFYNKLPVYNPQKVFVGIKDRRKTFNKALNNKAFASNFHRVVRKDDGWRFPTSVQQFYNSDKSKRLHPSQKPVEMFEWLIKTYSDEGDIILDNCIGSGTTALAAKQLKRKFIGIEISPEYCEVARKRLAQQSLS
jgi:site-specific DNA-methyltransferase (adenine-specific)